MDTGFIIKWETWVGVIIGILTIVGAIFGAFIFLDTRFAKEEKVEHVQMNVDQVGKRLDIKIVNDKFQAIQQRVWNLKDRYGDKLENAEQTIKEEYRNLEIQQEELKRELRDL